MAISSFKNTLKD